MKNTINYEAPALEVVELEIENAILAASGEYSVPEYESFTAPGFDEI
jgi:hypothetical protein